MGSRVEPITSFSADAASRARNGLHLEYERARQEILERSNYLKMVAQGMKIQEAQKARNLEFFEAMATRRIG